MSVGSLESESQKQEEEEAAIAIAIEQGIPQIGVDMFVKKKRKLLRFTDAYGNLVYKVNANSNNKSKSARVLLDPSGNPLISIFRSHLDGSWQGFKGDGCDRQLLFTVDQTLNTFNRIEFNICLITHHDRPNLAFTLRGCVFWRCCTIYHHNSILAQTNLMYKLGFRKNFVPRDKFRLTLFPGFADYNFTAALLLIFLDARKH